MTMSFKQFLKRGREPSLPILDEIMVTEDGASFDTLREGKWIAGRFYSNIRIDHATHGRGQTHAHVLGRKGNAIGVVNIDGSASHGTKCRLHDTDADALRTRGFSIPADNIVEWIVMSDGQPTLLLG